MADFFTEQYNKDNPEPKSSGSIGTSDNDFFSQQYTKDNPELAAKNMPLPGLSKENSIGDYLAAPFKGMVETGANMLPNNITSPQQALYGMNTEQGDPFNPRLNGTIAPEESAPKSAPKDQLESALYGAGSALGSPTTYIGGPSVAIGSVLGNTVTDWRNAASPNTPGWNNALGLVTSLLPYSSASKLFGGNNALTNSWKDLSISPSTAAGIGEDKSFPRTIRGLRESPFSDAINQSEDKSREQIKNKVNELADNLGTASTKDEAGDVLRNTLGEVRGGKPVAPLPGERNWLYSTEKDLAARNLSLDTQVNPNSTLVDISSIVPDLESSLQAPAGAFQMDEGANKFISKFKDAISSYGMGAAGYIPLSAIQYLKRNIGDQLSMGLFSMSDTSERNLMTIWSKLSTAEKQAYVGTPHETEFATLQGDWAQYFNNRKYVKNLITEGQSGGETTNKLFLNSGSTGERLEKVLDLVPEARGEIASYYLRNLGLNSKGEFNPDTFFNNWSNPKRLAPEAKQALFGDIDGDLPKVYDQLALVAREQARSEAARNYSGTTGTYELLRIVRSFAKNLAVYGGLPAAGAGATNLYRTGNENEATKEAGWAGIAGYGTAMILGPKLMSFGPFVRLLAKDPPIQSAPLLLRAFSTEYPQVAPEISALQNYVVSRQEQPKTGEERGFAEGGFAEGPEQADSQYAEGGAVGDDYNTKLSPEEEDLFTAWKKRNAPNDSGVDYDLRGVFKDNLNPTDNGHWSDKFKKPNHETFSDESKYAKEHPDLPRGNWAGPNHDVYQPPAGYALGGLTHTPKGTINRGHPNKFKGKQLQGFAQGGKVSTEQADVLPPQDTLFGDNKDIDSIIESFMAKDQGIYPKRDNKVPSLKMPTITDGPNHNNKDYILGHPQKLSGGGIPELNELENSTDVGVARRQSTSEQSLIDQIMSKYKLGPTAAEDAKNYAQELRWFDGLRQGAHEPQEYIPDTIQEHGFMGGGAIWDGYAEGGKVFSANDNKDPGSTIDWSKYKVQPVGMMKNPPAPSIIDTIMKQLPNPSNDKAEGGLIGLAQGGIADDYSNKAFYNQEPVDIDQGGWAKGGVVGYADGGPNWEVQHNNFGGMRIPGVNKTPTQGGFQTFNSPEQGVSKIRDQLMRYFEGKTTGKPINTLAGIVSTWAPPNENPTAALIKRAENILGIPANKPLDLKDANTMAKLIEATIRNEQGNKLPVDPSIIQKVANSEYLPSKDAENKREKGQYSRQEEEPSIIDQVLSQNTSDDNSEADAMEGEDDMNDPLKSAINEAPWIRPETKIASRAILER